MKIIFFLLLLNLTYVFSQTYSTETCVNVKDPTEKNQCISIQIDPSIYCCYVSYKIEGESFSRCVPLFKNEDGIKQYKDMMHKVKSLKIDCSSKFIKLNFLFVILFLIF